MSCLEDCTKDTPEFSLCGMTLTGKVVECYDADTCKIALPLQNMFYKFTCRLNGIDTPLDLFGFKDPKYNNEFNYFKDNYTPFDIGLIRRSYIMDLDDKNIIAIYEMKENCNAKLGDNIYIENHNIINTSLSSYTDRYYNVSLLEPFSKYITKIEAIYNTEIQNYNGYTKAVEYKLLTDKN